MKRIRFEWYAWGALAYTLAVIVWGAYVRATGSGAGCGRQWPSCQGEILPRPEALETLIEFTHRVTSGLAWFLALGLLVWALRAFPKGHPVRFGAGLSLFFMTTESLVGAGLVLFEMVADNVSIARAWWMSLHLINTFLLIAALTLTAWWASGGPPVRLKGQGAVGVALGLGLLGTLILGASGAVTALGDTLFPANNLVEGIRQDFSPTAHLFIRLRLFHPLIAVSVGVYLILTASLVSYLRPTPAVRRFAKLLTVLFLVQLGAGLLNLLLLAPVWMQLVHLLLADLVWIALVLLAAAALSQDALPAVPTPAPASPHAGTGGATWRDYMALTKPRVISLLLFTTLTAMIIAAGGWPGTGLFLAVALGGYMAAGAANAINMVIDRDIDGRMARTAHRPTVTHRIPSNHALLFAFALTVGSFLILWLAANLLTAALALAGLLFYVLVYTIYLKRRFWNNIVVGGAAGAFPPLVGWAAVTGELSLFAWYLFTIIFFWTPVHFWALALLIKEDYARVGVPMLPVVHGERMTVLQIALYAVLTALISIMPLLLGEVGWFYLSMAALLNLVLLVRSLELYRHPDRPHAVSLYKYSMLYLALLFLAMAVDRALWL
ncbi:heme o synthase [Marinithermus hydrothermalis]|uniref:Protoheme IX farnesyltransferase n=1 Tax=Marinithermus hydrothermalis (strain DSM 14884 / JCM 11576 / T1) TaxID=869210 RepID=F2NMV0_MARHT|nr:heme o synthase [Marinithermus hydrothermalis]AEB12689.1 Protoheme IX farnesyltransferase [Marinithermus hydrothermalis DSM 14884]